MGRFEQDPHPDPLRSVHIGWLFEHVRSRVPTSVVGSWVETVHDVIAEVRNAWGVNSSLDSGTRLPVEGLNPYLHSLSQLRFYQPEEGDPPISAEAAQAMRHDLDLAYGAARSGFESDIPDVPDGIAQLVLPPEAEPLPIGTLWVPGMEDLVVIDWTERH